ncbi:hypothetical protein, partial [Komagataeibacter europaeus]|uniref:hypothetical protein n=1 Tax=Komagataeibacter europaeus TaxID=33995 RepID=UPI000662483F
LYFAGGIAKMFAQYVGGNGALAWSNDVNAVNTSLASTVASQSNINAGFSANISDYVSGTVGMSQSGDRQMQGLCMRYSANNGNGLYPYATYKDGSGNTNNLPLVQSNAGTGFSVIYNAKMQYVSASEGCLWVDYVGGGSAKFVSADCGVIPASLDSNGYGCAGGTWELNGNVLTQSFVWIGEGNTAVSFYKAFSGVPVLNLSINEEASGTSRTPNINTNSDGTPNVSTTGFSFQPVFVASQAGTSTAQFHLNVTAKGVAA